MDDQEVLPGTTRGAVSALSDWRLLLISAVIGALLGAAIFQLFPPPYRAMARVVLDQNLEQALPEAPDREVFYFLERETQKLEELAWSDSVLEIVAEGVKGFSIVELRNGALYLSQPSDGGWSLYGVDDSAVTARQLAVTWTDAYTDAVRDAVNAASELEAVKAELSSLQANLSAETQSKRLELEARSAVLEEESHGIHPQVSISRTQKKDITAARGSSMGVYSLVGAVSAILIVILVQIINSRVVINEHEAAVQPE